MKRILDNQTAWSNGTQATGTVHVSDHPTPWVATGRFSNGTLSFAVWTWLDDDAVPTGLGWRHHVASIRTPWLPPVD